MNSTTGFDMMWTNLLGRPGSFALVFLLYASAVWLIHRVMVERWKTKNRNVILAKAPGMLGRLFPGLAFLFAAPETLSRAYKQNPGVPFAVWTPETSYVNFSSEQHVQEIRNAKDDLFSLYSWSLDILMPKYTMKGLDLTGNFKIDGSLHVKVLRGSLRARLPDFTRPLSRLLSSSVANIVHSSEMDGRGWSTVPVYDLAKKVYVDINARVFYGEALASNSTFYDAAAAYAEELLFSAEILRFLPVPLRALLAPWITSRFQNISTTMLDHIEPVVSERMAALETGKSSTATIDPPHLDCIQFFVETNGRERAWTARKIAQVSLGMWFASVHQPALTLVFALEDLCNHPEYVDPLREEVETLGPDPTAEALESLPLLDAFFRESVRLHPSEAITMRRKVMRDFTFQDGTTVLAGDVACVPLQAMMRDERFFHDSETFCAWRHLANGRSMFKLGDEAHRFMDPDPRFPFWGLGAHSCPGRFYASLTLKLFFARIVKDYDISLGEHTGARSFTFRTTIIPRQGATILFRKQGYTST